MNTRRTTLLIAIILAVGTGWLTLTYLSSLRPPRTSSAPVLDRDARHPRARAHHGHDVPSETAPGESLEPDAISDPNQAVGSLALITIPAGSQLTSSKIGTNVAFALPVRLQPGMRAVSIPVDRVKDVSGMIQPGDRVDVIAIPPGELERAAAEGRDDLPRNPRACGRQRARESVGDAVAGGARRGDRNARGEPEAGRPARVGRLPTATLRLALRSPREAIRARAGRRADPGRQRHGPGQADPAVGPPARSAPPSRAAAPAPAPRRLPTPVQLIIGDQIVDRGSSLNANE